MIVPSLASEQAASSEAYDFPPTIEMTERESPAPGTAAVVLGRGLGTGSGIGSLVRGDSTDEGLFLSGIGLLTKSVSPAIWLLRIGRSSKIFCGDVPSF